MLPHNESGFEHETPSQYPICGCRTTHIYCRPGCSAGKHMKPENAVYFQSREEARTSGYRPCKLCKPDDPDVEPETFWVSNFRSPLGNYLMVSSQHGIVYLGPSNRSSLYSNLWKRNGLPIINGDRQNSAAIKQLNQYFSGKLRHFDTALDLRGTAFQREIWKQLCTIPFGETCSYQQVARAVGRPKSARPAGQAIGHNPVSIIVPCHRVIASDGSLTGYGGGLEKKVALLKLEGMRLNENSIPSRVKVLPLP
jgi:O-6-methylguanine DNA methyltransferase